MKQLLSLIIAFSSLYWTSCSKNEMDGLIMSEIKKPSLKTIGASAESEDTDAPIQLIRKLENPYSVANMRIARENIIRNNPSIKPQSVPRIATSHYYVKFKPANEEELTALKQDTTLNLYEYPLDYEISEGGISYHDPEIPDSLPTYQYAAIDAEKWESIRNTAPTSYEILEELFIPDEDSALDDVDNDGTESFGTSYSLTFSNSEITDEAIDALVDEAMRITGNEEPTTRSSSKWTPSGTIRVYDDIADGMVPLKYLKVRARRWFTTHKGYTDANGHFSCNGKFKRPANYSIVWESGRFDIRDGNILQAYYNGPKIKGPWQLDIVGGKSVRYATIYRAAYRFYHGNTHGLTRPSNSRKEKIAYLHKKSHGPNGDYHQQLGSGIWSDIRIFGKTYDDEWRKMSEIFSTTCHELGHAAHYTKNSSLFKESDKQVIESWARCVQYYLTLKEYEDFGFTEEDINRMESFCLILDDGRPICTLMMIVPDYNYNFQKWTKYRSDNSKYYTTLFIDLIDDYNQQVYFYYFYKYHNNHNADITIYPNDDICMPISLIENIVFSSKNFTEVKQALKSYATLHPREAVEYNLSNETIDNLFYAYEL